MWDQTKTTFLEALQRIAQTLARLLPGLLAMILLTIFSAAVALVASAVVRRVGSRLEADRRLREWGMAPPAQAGQPGPTRFAARMVAWTVVATGFLVGLCRTSATPSSRRSWCRSRCSAPSASCSRSVSRSTC